MGGKVAVVGGLLLLVAMSGRADDTELEKKIAAVVPRAEEERWLQIPWRTDFAAARVEANKTGKPIYLWLMDGHPLGCT